MTAPDRCGTTAGHGAHRRRGERPCAPCRAAFNEYQRVRRQNPEVRLREYGMNTVRERAAWRLVAENRARFQELVAEELARQAAAR